MRNLFSRRDVVQKAIHKAVIELCERRVLLSGVPIMLDPTFGVGGKVLDHTVSVGVGLVTAYDPTTGNVIEAGAINAVDDSKPVELQRYSATGALDISFGTNGTVVTGQIGVPVRALVQPDGKLLIMSLKTTTQQYLLARYTTTGAADTSFGNGGSVQVSSTSFVVGRLTQPVLASSGDILIAGQLNNVSALLALTPGGLPDPAFGSGGFASGVTGSLEAVTIDGTGNLLAVGNVPPTASSPATAPGAGLVERFTPAGQLDASFGSGGSVVVTDVSNFNAVHVGTGGIAAYGQLLTIPPSGVSFQPELNHFTANGTIDNSFGPSGVGYVPLNLKINPAQAEPLFEPDGMLLIAGGIATTPGNSIGGLARIGTNGTLDSGFGTGGYANLGLANSASPVAGGLSIQPDNKILLAYSASDSQISVNGEDFDPTRVTSSGAPDTSFGPAGAAPGRPIFNSAQALAETPAGQTLVAGTITVGGQKAVYVRRYNLDGSIDSSFAPGKGFAGQNGYIFVGPAFGAGNPTNPSVTGLTIDASGNILIGEGGIGIIRLTNAGDLDTTFGTGGTANLSGLDTFLLETNGDILATAGINTVTRLTAMGAIDFSFNKTGSTIVPISFDTYGGSLAIQPDGKIIVGGYTKVTTVQPDGNTTQNNDLAITRLNLDGRVDTSFVTSAFDFTQFDTYRDPGAVDSSEATQVAVLANGNIVAAGVAQVEGAGWGPGAIVTAEFLPSGQLDTAYATGGVTPPLFPSGTFNTLYNSMATALFIQGDGSIVITGTSIDFNSPVQAEESLFYVLRFTANGALDQLVNTQFSPTPTQMNVDGPRDQLGGAALGVGGTLIAVGTDAPEFSANMEPALARYLIQPAGTISGTVFNDINGDGVQETGDTGIAGRSVYADLSNAGHYVAGDPTAVTNSTGQYTLTGVPAGFEIIRQMPVSGERQTLPTGGAGQHLTVGSTPITNANFGVTTDIYVAGVVFNDANGNGTKDVGEAGLANVRVFADLNHDLQYQSTEPSAITAADGTFSFSNLPAGTYTFLAVSPAGLTQSAAAGQIVSLPSGGVDVQLSFALVPAAVAPLTGTVIGTAGSFQNSGNTAARVFDGNLSTYFDAPVATGAYAGLDLGSPHSVTQISYAPRSGWASRMVGGIFQGSNTSDFSAGVTTLYTVMSAPTIGVFTTVSLTNSTSFRYVRYLGPAGGYCNVAEIRFAGNNATGSIAGSGFNDFNGDGIRQAGDTAEAGFGVYLDINHNGILDAGDIQVISDSAGHFVFPNLAPGTYYVRQITPPGYTLIVPTTFPLIVTVMAGQTATITIANQPPPFKLGGSLIGTAGSFHNLGNTIAKVFDTNLSTYFDAPDASGDWVGLDLGSAQLLTQIKYAPRAGWESRMNGGQIQASNTANFSTGVVTLYTIGSTPTAGSLTTRKLTNTVTYRYYRYIGPTNSYCDIAELELDG